MNPSRLPLALLILNLPPSSRNSPPEAPPVPSDRWPEVRRTQNVVYLLIVCFQTHHLLFALFAESVDPFDVLKTKMMTAGGKVVPSISQTAAELYAKQGIQGFYRGIDSNVARAMVLNGTKMGVYDQSKGYVVAYTGLPKKALLTQFMSAVTAGFFMTCTVAPFDMVRTRLMNQPSDAKIYNNAVDCMIKIATKEGPMTFWRGFFPIWSRFAPTTTLQLVIFEQLRTMMGMKSL
jgi:hypothetical protein